MIGGAVLGDGVAEIAPGVSKIADGLYQGALSCVVKHWDEVKDKFGWVVLAAEEIEKLPRGERHILVWSIPDDAEGLFPDEFWNLYFRVAFANSSTGLLCVCHMGENRSGLACVMALTQKGMPVEDAITLVRAEGNKLSPGVPHSFWNDGFARQCRDLLRPQTFELT